MIVNSGSGQFHTRSPIEICRAQAARGWRVMLAQLAQSIPRSLNALSYSFVDLFAEGVGPEGSHELHEEDVVERARCAPFRKHI